MLGSSGSLVRLSVRDEMGQRELDTKELTVTEILTCTTLRMPEDRGVLWWTSIPTISTKVVSLQLLCTADYALTEYRPLGRRFTINEVQSNTRDA